MFSRRNRHSSLSDLWEKRKSTMQSDPAFDAKVLEDAMEIYSRSEEADRAAAGRSRKRRGGFFKFMKWASLPASIAVLLLLLYPFGRSGVAWGKVVERVEEASTVVVQVQTMRNREGVMANNSMPGELTCYVSRKFGSRVDTMAGGKEVLRFYFSPDAKYVTVYDFKTRKLERSANNGSAGDAFGVRFLNDPTRGVKEFFLHSFKKIGKSTIEEKAVEGIEAILDKSVQNPEKKSYEIMTKRLWVDVTTGFPIRVETSMMLLGKGIVQVIDYQWNVPLDPSIFQVPEAPVAPGKK